MTRSLALLATASCGLSIIAAPSAAASAHHRHPVIGYVSDGRAYVGPLAHPARAARLPAATPRTGDATIENAVVSPNGKLIAENVHFLGKHSRDYYRIVVAHVDGTHARVITTGDAGVEYPYRPVWAPGSKRLYYTAARGDTSGTEQAAAHLMTVKISGGTPQLVPGGAGLSNPAVSPDGKRLAAISSSFEESGRASSSWLVTVRIATGAVSDPLLMVENPGTTDLPMFQPAWSPDGKTIAVVIENLYDSAPVDYETSQIDLVRAFGGSGQTPAVVVNGGPNFISGPVWRTSHELWFSKNHQALLNRDNPEPSTKADLYSVHVGGGHASHQTRRTHTPKVSERYVSFGG